MEQPRHEPRHASSSGDDESPGEDEDDFSGVQLLSKHTLVRISGNNRTKPALVGLKGVVKKAVGLGGWHWLQLENGVEARLQRNALTVLEAPSGLEQVRRTYRWCRGFRIALVC